MFLSLLALIPLAQTGPTEIKLWPNGAPGSESRKDEPEQHPHPGSTTHVYNPSITLYPAPENLRNGVSVVIAPGGGHTELGTDGEGRQPALFFNKLGITAFVLKYRLFREKGSGLTFDRDTKADTFRAMRLVRSISLGLGLDPNKVGMIGFSAGGENLSLAAFGPGAGDANAPDPIDRLDERPNFALWIYTGPLGIPTAIPSDSPPGFVVCADNDGGHIKCAFDLADRYRTAKLPLELHVLGTGGHGFGMATRNKSAAVRAWTTEMADWLRDGGWASSPAN
jgi:acetyl esterase/lipase